MNVGQFTTTNYINLSSHATIRSVLKTFIDLQQDIGCITRNKKLLGIVTKYSIYRAILDNCSLDDEIGGIMKREVVTLQISDNLYKAKDILTETNVSNAVVLNEKQEVCGVMTKTDVIRSFTSGSDNVMNRLRMLIENLQEAVISVDQHFKITDYNQAAYQLFQYDKKEIIDKPVSSTFPSLFSGLHHSFTSGEIIELEEITIQDLTVIASFIPLREFDMISGAMVVLRDITSYEKISRELETTKQLEKLLDSALEVAYDGVVIINNEGYIERTNQGFCELFSYGDPEKIKGHPLKVVAPDLPSQEQEDIEGKLVKLNQQQCILTQRPIYRNNQKLGVIIKIIFKQLDMWKDLFHHMEQLEHEITFVQGELRRLKKDQHLLPNTITASPMMDKVKEEAYIAAKSALSILITGESGTGKGVLSEDIHNASERDGAFIKVNCAAIPADLLEAEFFGYVDGAFTGAKKGGKPGKFELADRGTLFLDEIGDMPLALQAKLLGVLQEGEFERIGDTKTRKVDVRIIAATNKDIRKLVKEKTFREDLYYRLNVIHLHIPALRERKDDIPVLCHHFIKKISDRSKKPVIGVTPDALSQLSHLNWEGNIRQLENMMERAIHFCDSSWIEPHHLPSEAMEDASSTSYDSKPSHEQIVTSRKALLQETDQQAIMDALKKTNGNRTKAAEYLGISRSTLYQKLNKYNIKEISTFRS